MDYYYDDEQEQGSLIGGFLGGFVGALIGAIPWIIALSFGWMIGYFTILISVASFFGYVFLKGVRNPITIWASVIISTLVVMILMNYASLVFSIMKELDTKDFGYALTVTKQFLKAEPSALLENSLFSIIFGVLGIYSIRNRINAYL